MDLKFIDFDHGFIVNNETIDQSLNLYLTYLHIRYTKYNKFQMTPLSGGFEIYSDQHKILYKHINGGIEVYDFTFLNIKNTFEYI